MNVYTMFDKVAEECGPVFEAKNDAVALRAVSHLFQSNGATVSDFKLLHVASIDRQTCLVEVPDLVREVPIVGVGPDVESLNLPEEK